MPKLEVSRLREAIQARRDDITRLLCDLIRIPSTVGQEAPAVELLQERLQGLAPVVERVPIAEAIRDDPDFSWPVPGLEYGERANLRVVLPGLAPEPPSPAHPERSSGQRRGGQGGEAPRRSLLINTHLDVVPASAGQERPFEPQVREGVVYGRGACDAKGQVAAAWGLLAVLKDLGLPPAADLTFHFVLEEEVGGNGTVAMVREGDRADGCVVLEPSDFAILPQIRGAVWFETTVHGQAGHSGRPGGTVSALLKAIQAIEAFTGVHDRCLAESRGKWPLFDAFADPAPLTIGQLSAGDWPAQAPQKCVFRGVLGVLPDRTKEQVMEQMRAALRDSDDPWLAGHWEMEFPYRHDSSVLDPGHPLVKALEMACGSAGQPTRVSAMTASCDAWLYNNQLGIPTVVFGPGSLGFAHSDQERVAVEEVLEGVEVLVRLVERWCGLK